MRVSHHSRSKTQEYNLRYESTVEMSWIAKCIHAWMVLCKTVLFYRDCSNVTFVMNMTMEEMLCTCLEVAQGRSTPRNVRSAFVESLSPSPGHAIRDGRTYATYKGSFTESVGSSHAPAPPRGRSVLRHS